MLIEWQSLTFMQIKWKDHKMCIGVPFMMHAVHRNKTLTANFKAVRLGTEIVRCLKEKRLFPFMLSLLCMARV